MRVGRDTVVALDLELADLWGNPLQPEERIRYLHGYDEILPALERALEGKRPGEKLALRLEPEDAFGEYDERVAARRAAGRVPGGARDRDAVRGRAGRRA